MPDIDLGAVPRGSSRLRAYLARPDGTAPRPGVVAIHEVWGLDDVLRRQCDRLAAMGYLALAPDLFSDGGARRCVVSTFRGLLNGHGKAFADLEAARRRLLDDAGCTGRIGVIGFCMGGGFALATAGRGFDVASANYGTVPRDAERVLAGACPIIATYGRRDPGTRGMADKLERVLTEVGVDHEVVEYPAAGHSFLNDAPNGPRALRPLLRVMHMGPEPDSAADAWRRIERFFAEHLSG